MFVFILQTLPQIGVETYASESCENSQKKRLAFSHEDSNSSNADSK
jgi:hypothetical protein